MPLPAHLVSMFPPPARKQARVYVSAGDVSIRVMTDDHVEATVRGSDMYDVEVDLSSLDAPRLSCSCAAWRRWGPCKHLWATLVEADRRGLAVLQPARPPSASACDAEPPADWEGRLEALADALRRRGEQPVVRGAAEVLYVVDRTRSRRAHAVALAVFVRRRLRSGRWGILRSYSSAMRDEPPALETADRAALGALNGAVEWSREEENADSFLLGPDQIALFMPLLTATGRLLLGEPTADEPLMPLTWVPGQPWTLETEIVRDEDADRVRLEAAIVRGERRCRPEDVELCLASGLVIDSGEAVPLDVGAAGPWLRTFLDEGPIAAEPQEAAAFVERLLALPSAPVLRGSVVELIEGATPRPHLEARAAVETGPGWLDCSVWLDYESDRVRIVDPVSAVFDADGFRRIVRDADIESRVTADVLRHPEALPPQGPDSDVSLPAGTLVTLLPTLLSSGWSVEAAGKRYRASWSFRASVASGIDWFGISGGIEFDGEFAPMPELLRAIRAGSRTVRLGDGSLGLLPDEVLRSWGLLSAIGRIEDDGLRFAKHQGWVIDALLAGKQGVDFDPDFEAYRARLRGFEGIGSRDEPESFQGELRGYQREGLAWLDFLREFGCGGCLADDMGLGKTVQVLAMLEERRVDGSAHGPALVVAPRSVVFNWVDEAARFTPELKVLDYTGATRRRELSHLADFDLIVTTYGVLRRDIELLVDVPLDYAILDESQAVKNHATQASKAARALRARHRLALSGTPLENHLSELWALFEFLNPGMLGRSTAFRRLTRKGVGDGIDREGRALLARALRPFLLRRTKEQVAKDLPDKTEQTLYCEMPPKQRRLYRELATHYRETLLAKGAGQALAGSRMHVLEALLRLRQAACHPGLLDVSRQAEDCAKLDALMPLLDEIIDEGHKALVFSQFTSMLAIVRDRLDRAGIVYEYLDGQTRKRKQHVDRFQSDDACPLFLISLRAGGLGLNLTAADYVFILDPWWNPAVESQAIDRTYRIGQTRHVMAYRLVCKDSVEEQILRLQERKRNLADAILTTDNAVLSDLSPEDLELLLS